METRIAKLIRFFDDCAVLYYKGQVISDYSLLRESIEFFVRLIKQGSEGNGRGIILHPGSSIHLIMMTVIAALSCVLFEESSQEDVILNLNVGDFVIYEKKRGVFKGIDTEGRAVIEQSNSLISYIPQDRFFRIKPYKGQAVTLDGRGIRDNPEEHQVFLSKLLGVDPIDVPSILDCSVLIVCSRQEADSIINNTELCIEGGEKAALRNLFPAAYYTFNERYDYAGNYAKSEPVLRFTGRVSVARELIINDRDKNIIGLLVSGSSIIEDGFSELIGLLSRKSLRNVLLLSRIDDKDYRTLLNEFEDLQVFAWTKEAILSSNLYLKNVTTDEKELLVQYTNNILDKEINLTLHELDLDLSLNHLRKSLHRIARTEPASSKQEEFAINGFSFLNLLLYSVFPIKNLELQIVTGAVEAILPEVQLENLLSIASEFPGSLGKDMENIAEILLRFYESLYDENPKYHTLLKIICDSYMNRQKIAIIVPKQYYKTVFEATIENKQILKHCKFITKNSFRNDKLYDQVILSGSFKGKRFNLLGTNSSANISILAYNFEEVKVRSFIRELDMINQFYDSRNYVNVFWETGEDEEFDSDFTEFDDNLERYFEDLIVKNTTSVIKQTSAEGQQSTVEVIRVVTFETGERAFFTKNFCPYVFDPESGTVTETEVSKLNPGDTLIFTNHTDKTRDIVDKFLGDLVNSRECEERFKDYYQKSLYWKDVLRKHMEKNNLSFKELSDEMHELGYGKHAVTIRSWLDEDSHIVGPREPETFYVIALITQDKLLLKDPEGFCEACNEVRSMRMRILRYIGLSIIKSVGGTLVTDEYLEKLIGDASEFAMTLQIENIIQTSELFVPSHLANRPHEI